MATLAVSEPGTSKAGGRGLNADGVPSGRLAMGGALLQGAWFRGCLARRRTPCCWAARPAARHRNRSDGRCQVAGRPL